MRTFAILLIGLLMCSCGSDEPRDGAGADDALDGSVEETDVSGTDTVEGDAEADVEETIEGPCVSLTVEQVGELEVHPPSRVSLSFRVACAGEPVTDLSFPSNFDFRDDAELITGTDAVIVTVEDPDGSYYRIDYCSPRRSGPHDLQLRAKRDGIFGFISDRYTANGFTDGCIADRDVCPIGKANCDGAGADCETDLLMSDDNCGGCGESFACDSGDACVDGVCVITCTGDETPCGSSCVDLMTSSDHCGGCGDLCTWESEICVAGECECPSEAAEIADCDSECIECEAGSVAHCGVNGPNQCCSAQFPRFCDVPGWGADCFGDSCEDCDCDTVVRCPSGLSYLCPAGERYDCTTEKCE